MTTRHFRRAPAAFATVAELLDWSERQGPAVPTVYRGPYGGLRGSVETKPNDDKQEEH